MNQALSSLSQYVSLPRDTAQRQAVLVAVVTTLTMLLGLQSQRVFVPTMIFVVDQSNREQLVFNAAIVFLAIALIGAVVAFTGPRVAAIVSAILLCGSRLMVQFSTDPQFRWIVASLGVIGSGWLLVMLALQNRDALAPAVPVALWADISLRTYFDTVDLPYMATSSKDLITVVVTGVLVVAVAAVRWKDAPLEQEWPAAMSLAGLGAGIATYAMVSGNLGLASVMTGNDLQFSYWLLSLGPFAAVALWAAPDSDAVLSRLGGHRGVPLTLLLALTGAVGFAGIRAQLEQDILAGIALALFSGASIVLTVTAARGPGTPRTRPSAIRTTVFVTAGLCAHAALVFLYFAGSGSFLFVGIAYLLLVFAAFSSALIAEKLPESRGESRLTRPALIVATLVLAYVMASGEDAEYFESDLESEVTVVTYNIQNGFSRDNMWDLEATARTIQSLEPDVLLLQEIGRGWFAMGWADQVWWLSERLGMDFVFGPASKDNLWGNAILSAAPLMDPDVHKYTSNQNLNRSVVTAEIPVPGGVLLVASTHLDNPSGAGEVRMEQVEQLLAVWDGFEPAVIGGDLNSQPNSDVVAAMRDAGLVDAASAAGNPQSTSESGNRIDYIFVAGDVEISEASVPDLWTSDHRPLRVEIELAED